jgi:DNA replicative helicase MCM subunit Mcm2 (Cdc46/Mcm family)
LNSIKENEKVQEKVWSFDKLKLYLNYVKNLEPNLTEEANIVIQRFIFNFTNNE